MSSISVRPRSVIDSRLLLIDRNSVLAVLFAQQDAHAFGAAGGKVATDEVGPHRKLAVSAIHEHSQLHRARAADVAEGVEGGADGSSGVEDVVDEDDDLPVEVGHVGSFDRAGGLAGEVVAV